MTSDITDDFGLRRLRRPGGATAAVLLAVAMAACGRGQANTPGPGAGGPPAMAVEAVTLEEKPVERTSEFVGTIRSRRSTTIQPQVDGLITRIAVRSGDRVKPGTVLMEIDAQQQQASVASLESQRAARAADLGFARQQAERMKTLLAAGAASQQEYDQARTALEAAEAQVKAIEEQIRQQRVLLGYYRVTAPTAGTVGDIPVRVGDRVTTSTVLTTIDQNAGFEVYVKVPVQEAPGLRLGLPVRLLSPDGEVLAENPIDFIAPSVDDATQTVLVKTGIAQEPERFRHDQYVRAQIVWSASPGLTVPVISVNRINGQYFAFVVDSGEQGTVARQRPVDVGGVVGNDYVVRSGLKPGEQLIVSGIQKIADGMPVRVAAAGAPAGPGAPPAGAEQAGGRS
ncbi:MAG TPA: efflux RND transporter periplasmic adaptor subunit [Vicinamibacterales bacterium]